MNVLACRRTHECDTSHYLVFTRPFWGSRFWLLVFGCLARAPREERGRCLLTNFALAQFTTRLFWSLGNQWHLAFNIFDAVTTHTVAGGYTRPIHTASHNASPLNTD